MVAGVFNGVALKDDMVSWCRRITRGDVTRVIAGPQILVEARFTVDTSQLPHLIEYANLAGTLKGKKQAGIFERRGDLLEVCMAAPGKARPTEFSSTRATTGRTRRGGKVTDDVNLKCAIWESAISIGNLATWQSGIYRESEIYRESTIENLNRGSDYR